MLQSKSLDSRMRPGKAAPGRSVRLAQHAGYVVPRLDKRCEATCSKLWSTCEHYVQGSDSQIRAVAKNNPTLPVLPRADVFGLGQLAKLFLKLRLDAVLL